MHYIGYAGGLIRCGLVRLTAKSAYQKILEVQFNEGGWQIRNLSKSQFLNIVEFHRLFKILFHYSKVINTF